jgi:hypothetical protein
MADRGRFGCQCRGEGHGETLAAARRPGHAGLSVPLNSHVAHVRSRLAASVYDARGAPEHATGLRAQHAPTLTHCSTRAGGSPTTPDTSRPARSPASCSTTGTPSGSCSIIPSCRPLTNNEAGRALRHWVIARRIGMGTRTPQGTRAFALLASVIETCRKRGASPWTYLADVVRQRRRDLPPSPVAAARRLKACRRILPGWGLKG